MQPLWCSFDILNQPNLQGFNWDLQDLSPTDAALAFTALVMAGPMFQQHLVDLF